LGSRWGLVGAELPFALSAPTAYSGYRDQPAVWFDARPGAAEAVARRTPRDRRAPPVRHSDRPV